MFFWFKTAVPDSPDSFNSWSLLETCLSSFNLTSECEVWRYVDIYVERLMAAESFADMELPEVILRDVDEGHRSVTIDKTEPLHTLPVGYYLNSLKESPIKSTKIKVRRVTE